MDKGELQACVSGYQIEKIDKVREYTGENPKVSCDRLELRGELLGNSWDDFMDALIHSSPETVRGKYSGYALAAAPKDKDCPAITMIKMASPVVEMKNHKIFHFNAGGELDMMSDSVCRLYMDVDMIVIGDFVYSFNLKMETFFNLEKTMQKIKDQAINCLCAYHAFSNEEKFLQFAKAYPSPRTFLTRNQDRELKLSEPKGRRYAAELLGLKLDGEGRIRIESKDDASFLIRYICFKIFKDDETKGLLEAENVVKVVR